MNGVANLSMAREKSGFLSREKDGFVLVLFCIILNSLIKRKVIRITTGLNEESEFLLTHQIFLTYRMIDAQHIN